MKVTSLTKPVIISLQNNYFLLTFLAGVKKSNLQVFQHVCPLRSLQLSSFTYGTRSPPRSSLPHLHA